MASASGEFENHLPSQDDVAIIAFTSGTTGAPKATMHFHRDLLAILETVGEHVTRFSPGDVVMGSAPLGFTYGLGSLLLFPVRRGACSVPISRVTAEILNEAINAHGVNVLTIGPTLYRSLTALIAPDDAARLRFCGSSGEALPAAVLEGWRARPGSRSATFWARPRCCTPSSPPMRSILSLVRSAVRCRAMRRKFSIRT